MDQPEDCYDGAMANSPYELAAFCADGWGRELPKLGDLASVLAEVVGKPMRDVVFSGAAGDLDHETAVETLKEPGVKVTLTRENGLSASFEFPSLMSAVDTVLLGLGAAKTPEERRFDAFSAALADKLDGYGHLSWTVGSEDWMACADAALGRYEGKLFIAWHVVVDCESGGFTDTLETEVVEVVADAPAPRGILSQYLDICWHHYAKDQDGGKDPEKSHLQIDSEGSSRAIKEFDEKMAELWSGKVEPDLDWDEEAEEAFNPKADGWVDQHGKP